MHYLFYSAGKMKRSLFFRLLLCASMLAMIGGCGGYARTSDASGVQVYGTIDAGVSNQSR
jgi:hypothetical protein